LTEADRRKEIQANWDRAQDALASAKVLLENGHADASAARSYYAAFYAACALLLSEGMEFSKHGGVLSAIHKHFVHSGRLPKEEGHILNRLFELRSLGDYGETKHVPEADAKAAITAARKFVDSCAELLRHKGINGIAT